MMDEPTKLTLPFVAAQLKISYLQAYHLVLTGRIEGRKVGGHWFVSRASLDSFIAAHGRTDRETASE